jgi:hypothetical protein
MGYTDVETFIASGNVIFCKRVLPLRWSRRSSALEHDSTRDDDVPRARRVEAIAGATPFAPASLRAWKSSYVILAKHKYPAAAVRAIEALATDNDRFVVDGAVLAVPHRLDRLARAHESAAQGRRPDDQSQHHDVPPARRKYPPRWCGRRGRLHGCVGAVLLPTDPWPGAGASSWSKRSGTTTCGRDHLSWRHYRERPWFAPIPWLTAAAATRASASDRWCRRPTSGTP